MPTLTNLLEMVIQYASDMVTRVFWNWKILFAPTFNDRCVDFRRSGGPAE
jgi:hypothetical protein